MVDALMRTKALLKPDGMLIDIHPLAEDVPIYVQIDAVATRVGELDIESHLERYRAADRAVDAVVQGGHYTIAELISVELMAYFDSVDVFRQYVRDEWKNAELHAESWDKIETLMRQEGEIKQIYYSNGVRLSRLIPNREEQSV